MVTATMFTVWRSSHKLGMCRAQALGTTTRQAEGPNRTEPPRTDVATTRVGFWEVWGGEKLVVGRSLCGAMQVVMIVSRSW